MRSLPDTSALLRTHNHRSWAGSRPGKGGRCEKLSNSQKPNRSQILPRPVLLLPRYVKKFADITRPLHKASEINSPFLWTPEAQDAFETLQRKLMSTPNLALPSMKESFILYTDPSMTAIGAVLSPAQDVQERAVCCASKPFSKAQTKYSVTKRELLAVVNVTRLFRHYLLGRQFKMVTDRSALQWLHNFKDPDALTARWLKKLVAFNYGVVHRSGKSIGHANGLSRTPTRALNMVLTQ